MSIKSARIQLIKDTTANWESMNPILLDGEIGVESKGKGEFAIKIGDGISHWKQLPYATSSPAAIGAQMEELQAQLNEVTVASTTADTSGTALEVAQARVNSSGMTFPTLKERLDNGDSVASERIGLVETDISQLVDYQQRNLVESLTVGQWYAGEIGSEYVVKYNEAATGWKAANIIEVEENTHYALSGMPSIDDSQERASCLVANENNIIIGRLTSYHTGNSSGVYLMPEGARYLLISYVPSKTDISAVVKTSTSIIGKAYDLREPVVTAIPTLNTTQEVETARTDVGGTAFPTLKERLDNGDSVMKSISKHFEEANQLYDYNDVDASGYYGNDGKLVTSKKFGNVFIPCEGGKTYYLNCGFTSLTVTFWDNEKNFISSTGGTVSTEIKVPENTNIAYLNVPVSTRWLFDLIVSEKPIAKFSVPIRRDETKNQLAVVRNTQDIDYVQSRVMLSANAAEILEVDELPTGLAYRTKSGSCAGSTQWFGIMFDTIAADMCMYVGLIIIAESETAYLAFQPSQARFVSLQKTSPDIAVVGTANGVVSVTRKKLHVTVDAENFEIRDFYTKEIYLSASISGVLKVFAPQKLGLGVAINNAAFYDDRPICNIYASTVFVPSIPYQGVSQINQWYGKKWYAYGTSLTSEAQGEYAPYVAQFSGMELTNKGIPGGGIVNNTYIKSSVMNTTDGKLEADLITLEVGANDGTATLGDIYDTSGSTFCGALNQCIRYLQANTTAQIVVINSTMSRYSVNDSSDLRPPEYTYGADNHTKYDQWKATREVCRLNSVPCIGFGDESGMGYSRMNDSYLKDQIHHTELGGYNLAQYVWSKLKNIPCWYAEIPIE